MTDHSKSRFSAELPSSLSRKVLFIQNSFNYIISNMEYQTIQSAPEAFSIVSFTPSWLISDINVEQTIPGIYMWKMLTSNGNCDIPSNERADHLASCETKLHPALQRQTFLGGCLKKNRKVSTEKWANSTSVSSLIKIQRTPSDVSRISRCSLVYWYITAHMRTGHIITQSYLNIFHLTKWIFLLFGLWQVRWKDWTHSIVL